MTMWSHHMMVSLQMGRHASFEAAAQTSSTFAGLVHGSPRSSRRRGSHEGK